LQKKNKISLLWVVPKWTFPLHDGARVATDALVKHLSGLGAQVDILVLAPACEKECRQTMLESWGIRSVTFLNRDAPKSKMMKFLKMAMRGILYPLIPLTISSFYHFSLRRRTQQFMRDKEWDVLVLDGLHNAGAFFRKGKLMKPPMIKQICYRAHNCEPILWQMAARREKRFFLSKIYSFQGLLMAKFEREVVQKSDVIIPISREDAEDIKKLRPEANIQVCFIGTQFDQSYPFIERDEIKLLFLGKMSWAPNREGMQWFLRDIWPTVVAYRDDISLIIAGSGEHAWMNEFLPLKNIQFRGFVDCLDELYTECDGSIIPLLTGSGTRIKVIESLRYQRPCLSTELGMQGSTLSAEHYLKANTTQEWIDLLLQVTRKDLMNLALSGHRLLKNEFDDKHIAEKFLKSLVHL